MNFAELKFRKLHQMPIEAGHSWKSFVGIDLKLKTEPYGFYEDADGVPYSDIVLSLPVLEWYASLCDHVTEFGTYTGNSTVALIAGARKKVVSYDINPTFIVETLRCMELPCEWEFHNKSTIDPSRVIDETDMLFVDTEHTYQQVEAELRLHGHKVKRFFAFHDISSPCGYDFGPAVTEYFADKPHKVAYRSDANNGLLVLERV